MLPNKVPGLSTGVNQEAQCDCVPKDVFCSNINMMHKSGKGVCRLLKMLSLNRSDVMLPPHTVTERVCVNGILCDCMSGSKHVQGRLQ